MDTAIEAVSIAETFQLCQDIAGPGGTLANIAVILLEAKVLPRRSGGSPLRQGLLAEDLTERLPAVFRRLARLTDQCAPARA